MQRKRGRVYGPYPNRRGVRFVVVSATGARRSVTAAHDEAEQLQRDLEAELAQEAVTVNEALPRYEQFLRTVGNKNRPSKARSIETTRQRIRAFFPDGEEVLADIDERRAAALYAALAGKVKVDTHRNALGQARTFLRWCARQGWVHGDPLGAVLGVGDRRKGKDQLRVDEAGRLYGALLSRLGDDRACASMVGLLLGLRASEIVGLVPRDVDAKGTLLWVPGTKSRAARRTLPIPEELRDPLLDRAGRDRLFPYRREWVRDAAIWSCRQAGVDEVCAHALRGLHATLRVELAGLAGDMGHSDQGQTASRHYIAPGTAERAAARRVGDLLASLAAPETFPRAFPAADSEPPAGSGGLVN